MKDGWIRVGADCPAITVADPQGNAATLASAARRAAAEGVRVLVFPELCLTADTAGDLFFAPTLLEAAEAALSDYIAATAELPLLSFVGLPVRFGGRLYNAVAAVSGGRLLGLVPKTYPVSHGESGEGRVFAPAMAEGVMLTICGQDVLLATDQLFVCREMPALRVAVEVGEDLFAPVPPSSRHASAGATLIVNPSAHAEGVGRAEYRRLLLSAQAARLPAAYVMAGAGDGESGTDLVFGGHHIIAEGARLLAERPPFEGDTLLYTEPDLAYIETEAQRSTLTPAAPAGYTRVPFSLPLEKTELSRPFKCAPFLSQNEVTSNARCELILQMQAKGLAGRFVRARAATLVLGLSGGLDSTLALLVALRAAEEAGRAPSSIIAVTMPGFGTTARTRTNAEELAEALGVTLRTIPIGEAVRVHFADIGHDESERNVVYENAQARERTQVLMDIANAENGLVVGTGDLSELALGWATYNGDHMSMYGVNAGVPKTLVRHLVAYAATLFEEEGRLGAAEVLRDILATPVSPELLPPEDGEIAQVTEHIVGPYELHDFFLYHTVRRFAPPRKIARAARAAFGSRYDGREIDTWLSVFLRRFFSQQFKRSCLPDGPKIGSVSLSPRGDWRMPSDASAAAWQADLAERDTE